MLVELLDRISKIGVTLFVKNGRLHYRGAIKSLSDRDRELLRKNKNQIIKYLNAYANSLPNFSNELTANSIPPMRLTSSQQGLWFLHNFEKGAPERTSSLNVYAPLRLRGVLHAEMLIEAIRYVANRHFSLCSHFVIKEDEVLQELLDNFTLDIEIVEASESHVQDIIDKHAQKKFDLLQGPPWSAKILHTATDVHVLLLTMHHIITDGWSMKVFFRELSSAYSQLLKSNDFGVRPLPPQYFDFSGRHVKCNADSLYYWSEKIKGAPQLLELPKCNTRPIVRSGNGESFTFTVREENIILLEEFCRKYNSTLFMVLFSIFNVVISRFSNQYDLLIGVPMSERSSSQMREAIGYFVNTFVYRTSIEPQDSFLDVLEKIRKSIAESYSHQNLPFAHLVEEVCLDRSSGYSPLVQVLFSYFKGAVSDLELPGIKVEGLIPETSSVQNDLTFLVFDEPHQLTGLIGRIEFNSDIYDKELITKVADSYVLALKVFLSKPELPLKDISLLCHEDKKRLIEWNDTQTDYPQDKCIHELFEEQAEQHPDNIALIFEDEELTYKALNERANQVAHYLIAQGVKPDTLVGLCVERSLEMVIGLIGILKAGGAYVPIDPDYPEERIRYMLEDSGVNILLSQSYLCERLPVSTQRVVYLDSDEDGEGQAGIISSQSSENIPKDRIALNSQHLAYVIYTSGSTGRPKGVMTEHKALLNRIDWMQGKYPLAHQDKVLQKTPFSFDVSVWELTWPFIAGAGLLIAKPQGHKDTNYLIHLIKQYKITVLHFVPSMLSQMVLNEGWRDCTSLTNIFCSGEALGVDLVSQHYLKNDASLHNLYGPTEAAIDVSAWHCPRQASPVSIPIGSPIQNIQLHVMSASQKIQAVGVVGEMYIGGAGLARGYLNNPELTAEKFIANPFSDDPDERLYRTGDLVRWLPDGNLEFIGRIDDQVKIRGFRIELGEIESQLQMHESVRSCVVVVREDIEGDKRLVAYVVIDSLSEVEDHVRVLREHLQQQLPEYMLPSAFVVLDELPLTSNGKIDRKSLPAPEGDAYAQEEYVAPETETEEVLVGIWSDLLGLEAGEISTRANFFALGGHSLLVVQLISRLQQLNLFSDVRSVFSVATLGELASVIDGQAERAAPFVAPVNMIPEGCKQIRPSMLPLIDLTEQEIAQVVQSVPGGVSNIQDIYPLAPLQEGIFFHHLMEQSHDPYILSALFNVRSNAQLDSFLEALQWVITRHDVLRTAVLTENLPVPVQVVYRAATLEVGQLSVPGGLSEEQVQDHLQSLIRGPQSMDLTRAPLLDVQVAHHEETQSCYMLLRWHHLIADHEGFEIIGADALTYLTDQVEQLPAPMPYREFVAHALHQAQTLDAQAYFQQRLGDVTEPTLPFDLRDVHGDGSGIEEARQELSRELSLAIRATARDLQMTPAVLFHAAWSLVVAACSGREDVVFGTVLSGRLQGTAGADRMLGMFINTLPLKVSLAQRSVVELVKEIEEGLRELLVYEQASLSLAQRCSGLVDGSLLFSALLNYRHSASVDVGEGLEQADFGIRALAVQERTNYPFAVSVNDLGEGFSIDAQVDRSVSVRRVIAYLEIAITGLVEALQSSPEMQVLELSVLPEAERHQQLIEWNDTQTDYPQDKCIHELFEEQAEQHPDNIALIFEDEELTYKALNERANQVAHYLIAQGVKPDTLVGLCVERSLEMVIGLIGILKAGGAYVPIDPDYPEERIRYMLEDSGVNILLSQSYLCERLPVSTQRVVYLDSDEDGEGQAGIISSQSSENIPKDRIALNSQHLAYVIYTSGSTGRPKGVMTEHKALLNRIDWMQGKYPLAHQDKVLQKTPFSFDVSVWELTWPFIAGAGLLIAKPQGHKDTNYLIHLIKQYKITVLHFVPSMLSQMVLNEGWRDCTSLTNIFCSGEALGVDLVSQHYLKNDASLHNLYGPTEAAIDVSAWHCPRQASPVSIPIGSPIQNIQLHVMSASQKIQAVGVVGEMYIGGAGLARGYLNNPELTAEKFIANPFSDDPDERLYRTGDLVRWLPDGNLEFIGRIDDQVKIRGFRIELGEIESQLQMHESVRSCVVVVREDIEGDKRLVAYVVIDSLSEVEDHVRVLREHLQQQLPEYMLPSAFVVLDELPLTSNGKIDRKSLPAPEGDAYAQEEYVAPETETEEVLVGIWSDLLGLEAGEISTRANFFALGGHSLLVVQLISRLQQLNLFSDVRSVFSVATLGELASVIDGQAERAAPFVAPVNMIPEGCKQIRPSMLPLIDLTEQEIAQVVQSVPGGVSNIQDIYPLAPLQEGIFFHHLMEQSHDPYILSALFNVRSNAQLDSFLEALQWVITRHDVLRTAVLTENLPVPVQVVYRAATLEVGQLSVPGGLSEEQVQDHLQSLIRGPQSMDLTRAPLLDVQVAHHEETQSCYMLLRWHHLIADHEGFEIIGADALTYLTDQVEQLPAPMPYREFVAHALHQAQTLDAQAYFQQRLGDVTEPTLPFDLRDVHGDGSGIEEARQELSRELSLAIRATARDLQMTPAVLFHAAWSLVVAACSGREDVVFGTVLSGRLQGTAGADRMLGMFINTLPLKVSLAQRSVVELVKEIEEGLRELLVYEQASLSLAQRCSGLVDGSLLFSALLNYRHSASVDVGEGLEQADFGIRALAVQERTNYPFAVSVNDLGEGFSIDAQVDRSVSVRRVIAYLEIAITGLVEALQSSPEMQVLELSVLPEAERHQQLIEWNDTQTDYPQDKCIHELFEEQAEQHPDNIALIFEDEELTYKALNERANQVAHYLIAQGVKPDTLVGLCVERSLEMVIGLIGILKAGGAYVPIDPDYPEERIRYMLEDSGVNILLSQSYLCERLPVSTQRVVYLDSDEDGEGQAGIISSQSSENIPKDRIALNSQHLAYVIYTSGSTGQPKGVLVEHHNAARLFYTTDAHFCFSQTDVWTLFHSFAFDFSVWEIWGSLGYGGRLVVVPQKVARSLEDYYRLLVKERVTVLNQTPSAFAGLIEVDGVEQANLSLRIVVLGGEALTLRTLKPWIERHGDESIRLVNMYGITETTVHVTYKRIYQEDIERGNGSVIGQRLGDLELYLLDDHLSPAPIGVIGEIYVGGRGVARGYLNNEELTKEKFIKSPFNTDDRLYKTGDLARFGESGELIYLGRIDDQVKIRGFRIELGEIESQLQGHESVRSCVVVVREDIEGDKRLVAYVVIGSLSEVEDHARVLREHLLAVLPEYMVPYTYVELEKIPLTSNGKVDVVALPKASSDTLVQVKYVGPKTELEKKLAAIWQSNLHLENIGTRDNYFALGGDSIRLLSLVTAAREQGINFSLKALYSHPTIETLAAAIARGETENAVISEISPFALLLEGEKELLFRVHGADKIEDAYPLSVLQQGMVFHTLEHPELSMYHDVFTYRIRVEWQVDLFQSALSHLIKKHPALRTVFYLNGRRLLQAVLVNMEPSYEIIDIHELEKEEADGVICEWVQQEKNRGLDFSIAPWRVNIHVLSKDEVQFGLSFHHALLDGWSVASFLSELMATYSLLKSGEKTRSIVSPPSYKYFVALEQECLKSEEIQNYWSEKLEGAKLPWWSGVKKGASEKIVCKVTKQRSEALANIAEVLEVQDKSVWYAIYLVLISLLDGSDEVVGSVLTHGRPEMLDSEKTLGLFLNSLPTKIDIGGRSRWNEVVKRVEREFEALQEVRGFPSAEIQLQTGLNLSSSLFNYVDFHVYDGVDGENESVVLGGFEETSFSFIFQVVKERKTKNYSVVLDVDSGVFGKKFRERIGGYVENILDQLLLGSSGRIEKGALLGGPERHQQLIKWNDTQMDYPQDKCIHELFEEQAEQHPDNIALIFEDEELTYKALNERANQVAHYLIAQGVKPDTLVGLCVERSLEMVIGLIGILKAGGAYVPIDPDYPEERIRYMLEHSGVDVLLSLSHLSSLLPITEQQVIYLDTKSDSDDHENILSCQIKSNPTKDRSHFAPEHLAYVMYTSGTTGRPKGVMIEQHSVINLAINLRRLLHGEKDPAEIRWALNASICFDASIQGLCHLLLGGSVVIVHQEVRRDITELIRLFELQQVSHWDCTPAQLQELLGSSASKLPVAVVGGEIIGDRLWSTIVDFADRGRLSVFNVYGPTEACVDTTLCPITNDFSKESLGGWLGNIRGYIVDSELRLLPTGVAGELCVGGVGLARGYLNNPELTAEKFIANPFSDDPDERLYRTGDLVRWLPDGNLEFIGRIDDQVKIRGFRIELGEIESQLQMHESVRSCVVVVREDIEGDKRLVAYVVIDSLSEVEDHVRVLREHLQQQLPEYMLPSAFVVLDELPLTSNGKIDRKSLPAPEGDAYAQEEYVAPETETEEVLVGIWSDLLGLEAGEISTRANFFALGGHSLLATRLVNLIFQRTGKELSLRSVFESPNVDKLAFLIDQLQTATEVLPLTRCNREQAIPLSFAQQRLWFLYKLEGANGFYNIPLALRISGEINTNALIQSIEAVVARHEALRTRFVEVDGVATQVIDGVDGFKVIQEEISEQALQSVCKSEASAPFDLSVDRLLRAHFFNVLESEDHVLLVTMHHIVSDGWSMEVFYREVVDFYQAFCQGASPSLAELPIQYADFAHWQRQWLGEEVLQIQRDYWQQQLSGLAPLLTFPTDHPRPPVKSYRGANEPVHFSVELLDQLKALGERQGVTLYMTLLSGFSVLLGRYTGQEDIPIGSPVANRNRPEVENLIGFFVNTLVMRTDLSGDQSFTEILAQVKETALGAYAHQDIPFEHLVEVLNPERSMNYTPLFQVMFALQSTQADEHVDIGDLSFSPLKSGSGVAKFDLTLTVRESASGLLGSVEYDSDLFEAETIRRFIEHYQRLLKAIVAEPEAKISEYEILSEAERHQQLIEWNDTQTDYPQDKCIHELFEEQAEQHPDNIALIFEDEELTYKALNERANQVAHYLIAQGVKPDTLVGLCVERSLEMVIGLIGILKAGGAYVPIDPDYPEERIRYMLEDSGVNILLSQSYLCERLPVSTQRVVYLDSDEDGEGQAGIISSQSSENIPKDRIALNSQHLAYVIYTSGSTGRPKGVMIEHRGVARFACNNNFTNLGSHTITLHHSPISLCESAFELWAPLLNGGHIVIYTGLSNDLDQLRLCVANYRVNTLWLSAGLLPLWIDQLRSMPSLEIILLGGGVVSPYSINKLHGKDCRIRAINVYGSAENITFSCCYAIPENVNAELTLPIGKPILQSSVYILDARLQQLPIGVVGELYVGGAGLARGYLNNPELTAEKFIVNPLSDDPGERLYRTGDLARWLPDGNLEFVGCIDDQVKIHGFKLELGDIESQLQKHELVRNCVVAVREDIEGNKYLAAYVVINSLGEGEDCVGVLRKYLQQRPVKYMLPSAFVVLDELPLTSNGKIDRKSLPAPEGDAYAQEEYVAPETETEEVLVGIWSDLLGLEAGEISTRANFFALGGHSLMATHLVNLIQKEFEIELPLGAFISSPTIVGLGECIFDIKRAQRKQLMEDLVRDTPEQIETGEL